MGEAEIIDQFIAAVIEHKEMPLYAGIGALLVLIMRLARKKDRHETKNATEAQKESTAAQIEHTAAIKENTAAVERLRTSQETAQKEQMEAITAQRQDQQKNHKELLDKLECIKRLQVKNSHNQETIISNQKEITSKVMDTWANTKNQIK